MSALTAGDVGLVLREIFEDLGEDLDVAQTSLTSETKLIDLGMESISLVYLVSELQQHYALGDRLFRQMRDEGIMIRNLSVGDIEQMVVSLKNVLAD
jgi:aryl carrier-like protein